MKLNKLLLLQWSAIVAHVIAEDPPPGCLCTVEQCCQNGTEYDCSLLTAHLGLLESGPADLTSFCDSYINNSTTKDASIGVCDAILEDVKFQERFVTSTNSRRSASFWTELKRGLSCSDLVTDSCPLQTIPFESSSWTDTKPGTCSSTSKNLPDTTNKIVWKSGCKDEEVGVLDLFHGVVPIISNLDTCPTSPNAMFTIETSKGIDQQRWMCQELTTVINGNVTTIMRLLHVNLGNFPCTGLEETPVMPTSSAEETPSTFFAFALIVVPTLFVLR